MRNRSAVFQPLAGYWCVGRGAGDRVEDGFSAGSGRLGRQHCQLAGSVVARQPGTSARRAGSHQFRRGGPMSSFVPAVLARTQFRFPAARAATRWVALLAAMLLFGLSGCWAADNPVAGKWDCTSDDGAGKQLTWTLVVKEDRDKLSGSLLGGPEQPGEIPLIDPKLAGNAFTFKVYVNEACTVEVKLKIEGKKLDGTFACPGTSGTFKGLKQS